MKKNIVMLTLLNAIFLTLVIAQQQQYPNLLNVHTRATVIFNTNDEMYFYAYAITNNNTNSGSIDELAIEISRIPSSIEIDTIGLRFQNDGFTEGSFRRHFPHLRERIVPVGFIKNPEKWTASLSNDQTATFFTTRSFAIRLGQSISGFEMMSKGLPGIRRCIVSPFFDVIALFPDPADTTITYYVPPVDSVRQAVKFYGWTIGPTAPPINFVPTTWIDTLLSYARQSVQLGWLKSGRDNDCDGDEKPQDGVSNNLEKRLEKVRTELTKGNNLKASKELEKFIKKIERVSKRTDVITSEAYALLKYNAEYLVSRIITLPTKPAGTVLQQIDELKAELTRQSNKKNIGGVVLVKSLSFLTDKAKFALNGSDSAKAALSIAAFQLFVDEVWELTGALSKKNKKPVLYVYDEGYIQLHYRAKYILESLPAPRTLIDMKSVEMDDETRKELDAMRQMTKEQ